MNLEFLNEPELAFGGERRHIDIRFGLSSYGPLDVEAETAPKRIRVGIVGTPQNVEHLRLWLEKCREELPPKRSRQPNLFPPFPGFSDHRAFQSSLVLDDRFCRMLPDREIDELLLSTVGHNNAVEATVERFVQEFEVINENHRVDVLICAVPRQLVALMDSDARSAPDQPNAKGAKFDFHDLLKARAMRTGVPVQLVLPQTYGGMEARRQKVRSTRLRLLQDDATRAWNFHTALYYKAGGHPWKVPQERTQLDTCYVGVSFYFSLDRSTVRTSMAQVFNQRGDGVILRGGPVHRHKDDRVVHLASDAATTLLDEALKRYKSVHFNLPARIVLHKTSPFNDEELNGFRSAASHHGIERFDAVSLTRETPARLFRLGAYPPLRGTLLHLDDKQHCLYMRGSVDFYQTYPGPYIPHPLAFRCDDTEQTPRFLANELLALSKMNWNDTQFDGGSPITITAARKVGGIMKYLADNDKPAVLYSHYM